MICSFVLTSFHLLLLLPYVTSFPVKSLSLSKGVFECKNQEKIPRGWQCDGETDCQDGSDEMDCSFIKRPCNDALGVSDAQVISDSNFHASSSCQSLEGATFHPWYARLFQTERDNGAGSWCASTMSPEPHWIAVNLGKEFVVTKIATQGRSCMSEYVTKFKLQFSVDDVNWEVYKYYGHPRIFSGSSDSNTVVYNKLEHPIKAKSIKIFVMEYHLKPCLRLEVYGCDTCITKPNPDCCCCCNKCQPCTCVPTCCEKPCDVSCCDKQCHCSCCENKCSSPDPCEIPCEIKKPCLNHCTCCNGQDLVPHQDISPVSCCKDPCPTTCHPCPEACYKKPDQAICCKKPHETTCCKEPCPAICFKEPCPTTCCKGPCPATCKEPCPATCCKEPCPATCKEPCPTTCCKEQCPNNCCEKPCPQNCDENLHETTCCEKPNLTQECKDLCEKSNCEKCNNDMSPKGPCPNQCCCESYPTTCCTTCCTRPCPECPCTPCPTVPPTTPTTTTMHPPIHITTPTLPYCPPSYCTSGCICLDPQPGR